MGKFLNLTDGLFGQGRRDLFLVTFNEAIAEIDPAFLRPGRCRAILHFPALSRRESEAWLERHDLPATTAGDLTLADLYRRLHVSKRGPDGDAPAAGPGMDAEAPDRIGFFIRQGHNHVQDTGTL